VDGVGRTLGSSFGMAGRESRILRDVQKSWIARSDAPARTDGDVVCAAAVAPRTMTPAAPTATIVAPRRRCGRKLPMSG
jgi:hypothetical protein